MSKAWLESIKRAIRIHRRAKPFSMSAAMCKKFLHSYYNEDFYDFHENGESFVLEAFSRWAGTRTCTIWDIGANHGQWAREANAALPHAQIVSFELIPAIANEIAVAATSHPWWSVERCGMSNKAGTVDILWNRSSDDTSSFAPDLSSYLYATADVESVRCEVTTADKYWDEVGTAPDFLKIDAEGHDWAVLEGAERLISSDAAPAVIQFEYGRTWIPSQRMLGPVHKKLESCGYHIGRLFPNYVDFKPYSVADEHFRMGNMIATRDRGLHALLTT